MDLENALEKYAALVVETGIHMRPGEGVIINGATEAIPLARAVSRYCYAHGAKDVIFNLNDDEMAVDKYRFGSDGIFTQYPAYKANYLKTLYDDHYHHLFILSSSPQLYESVDSARVNAFQRTAGKVNKETGLMAYRMTGKTKWTICAVPSEGWAKVVFPDKPAAEAVDALWKNILMTVRVDQPDPIAAWQAHDAKLKHYRDTLNQLNFEKLHYQAPGTDLTVYLAKGHLWVGGSKTSLDGDDFTANMPTEEIFSTPDRNRVDGTLRSTKPLSLNGKLVEGLELVFENGKVTRFTAKEGAEVFEKQLDQDEGARYLGEVALVPDDSPISNTGIIFKNTLFDENASCHFAIGQSYGYAMVDGEAMSEAELVERGANQSIVHTDFMVGSPQMRIVGTTFDGKEHVVFDNGNWAIA